MSKSFHRVMTEEEVVSQFAIHPAKDHRREKWFEVTLKKKKRLRDEDEMDFDT